MTSAFMTRAKLRPLMKRASMAEMVVPYGDPRGASFRRNAFDTGEYGHRLRARFARAGLRLPRQHSLLRHLDPTTGTASRS